MSDAGKWIDATWAQRVELADAMIGLALVEAERTDNPHSTARVMGLLGGKAVYTPLSPFLCQTKALGFDAPVEQAHLERLEKFYFKRDTPAQIVVTPYNHNSVLSEASQRGFTAEEFEQLLWLNLDADTAHQCSDVLQNFAEAGLEVRPLTQEDRQQWALMIDAGFADRDDWPEEDQDGFAPLFRLWTTMPMFHGHMAWVDGEPAGVSTLNVTEDLALLGVSSVLPKMRRRGVHRALIAARLLHACGCGVEQAVVSTLAGSISERNMQRAGFAPAYTRLTMIKPAS